jgi:hypothetical protein
LQAEVERLGALIIKVCNIAGGVGADTPDGLAITAIREEITAWVTR